MKKDAYHRWLKDNGLVCNHSFPRKAIFLKPCSYCGMPPDMSPFAQRYIRDNSDLTLGNWSRVAKSWP